jgi:hypothetical protein
MGIGDRRVSSKWTCNWEAVRLRKELKWMMAMNFMPLIYESAIRTLSFAAERAHEDEN